MITTTIGGTLGCYPHPYQGTLTVTWTNLGTETCTGSTISVRRLRRGEMAVTRTCQRRERVPAAPTRRRSRMPTVRIANDPAPIPCVLPVKAQRHPSLVAWVRGRTPQSIGFRLLRLLGVPLRR